MRARKSAVGRGPFVKLLAEGGARLDGALILPQALEVFQAIMAGLASLPRPPRKNLRVTDLAGLPPVLEGLGQLKPPPAPRDLEAPGELFEGEVVPGWPLAIRRPEGATEVFDLRVRRVRTAWPFFDSRHSCGRMPCSS
jgi:hypothetical protein